MSWTEVSNLWSRTLIVPFHVVSFGNPAQLY